jgi:hypothetical protein
MGQRILILTAYIWHKSNIFLNIIRRLMMLRMREPPTMKRDQKERMDHQTNGMIKPFLLAQRTTIQKLVSEHFKY